MIDARQEKITSMHCASESGSNCAKAASSKRRREKNLKMKKKREPSQEPDDADIIDLTKEPQMPITQQTNECDDIIDLTQE